jgi:ribosomal protein L7/L12
MGDYFGGINMILLFALLAAVETIRRKLDARADVLQRRLDAIAKHLNVKTEPAIPPEILGLLQAGRKIEAIKAYRQATGAGLAEAKTAVERMEIEAAGSTGTIIQT